MSMFLFALLLLAMLAVLASLAIGVFVMARGGEVNKKYGNKLMQARVMLQGLAIVLFILAALSKSHG